MTANILHSKPRLVADTTTAPGGYQGANMKNILCIVAAMLFLAGCNTVEGVGKDLKKGGEAIEKSADRNKTY